VDALPIGREDVERAAEVIRGRLHRTPILSSRSLRNDVYLKAELLQRTGSFKPRGVLTKLASLTPEERARGVIGISAGNHAQAVAWGAAGEGLDALVVMWRGASEAKVSATRGYGASVDLEASSPAEAFERLETLLESTGRTLIHPFDDPLTIAGQGTVGLEILEDLPGVETVIVPVSGGGLIAGVARAIKSASHGIRVIGVSMERGCAMYESHKAGRPVQVEELPTLADALGGGVGLDNRYTFAMVRDLVDDLLLVSEQQIAGAVRHAYCEERQVIEGSGAVGIAALMAGLVESPGVTAVVVSGGNIDMTLHARLVRGDAAELAG
jgi:threonine dehydratase